MNNQQLYGPLLLSGGTVDTNYMRRKQPIILGMSAPNVQQTGDMQMQGLAFQAPDQAKYLELAEEIEQLEDPTQKKKKKEATPEEIEAALKLAAEAAGGSGLFKPKSPFGVSSSLARQRAMAGFGRSYGR